MDNGHFEDVFPIENGDIPASYVSLPEGNWFSEPSTVGRQVGSLYLESALLHWVSKWASQHEKVVRFQAIYN